MEPLGAPDSQCHCEKSMTKWLNRGWWGRFSVFNPGEHWNHKLYCGAQQSTCICSIWGCLEPESTETFSMLVCGYCFMLGDCLLCTKYFCEPSEVFLTVQVVEVERRSWTLGGKPCLKTHCSTESESGCNSHPDRDSSQNAPAQHTHTDHSQCSSECWPTVSPYVDSWGSVDLGWFLKFLVPRCQLALLGLFLVSPLIYLESQLWKKCSVFSKMENSCGYISSLYCVNTAYTALWTWVQWDWSV